MILKKVVFLMFSFVTPFLLVGCATLDWKKAQKDDTIQSYEKFCRRYINSDLKSKAKKRIETLSWQKVKQVDRREGNKWLNIDYGYAWFLWKYPQSEFSNEAKTIIEKYEWEEAKRINSIEECQSFLSLYALKNSVFEIEAKKRIKFMKSLINEFNRVVIDGRIVKVRELIDIGADVNYKSEYDGETPLIDAVQNNHIEIVRILIDAGAKVDPGPTHGRSGKGSWEGVTALIEASNYGNNEMVQLLIDAGADVNASSGKGSWEGVTALMIASKAGHKEIVKLLIDAGADVHLFSGDYYSRTRKSALIFASKAGHKEIVNLLIDAGETVGDHTKYSYSALMHAVADDDIEMAMFLDNLGANCISENAYGESAFSLCGDLYDGCKWKEMNSAIFGIQLGLDKNSKELVQAVKNGNTPKVSALLKNGAYVNTRKDDSMTPLCWASYKGFEAIVKLLLEAKADINIASPLCWASKEGHIKIVRLLLASPDVNKAGRLGGKNALDWALQKGQNEIAQLLQNSGMFLSSDRAHLDKLEYFIKFSGENGPWTQVVSPYSISCEKGSYISMGKLFDKTKMEWRCTYECSKPGESTICEGKVRNMSIRNGNSVLIFEDDPGYLPW